MVNIDREEYIKSLENILIFMCKNYSDTEDTLLKLANEEKNRAFFEVPRIQGTNHIINISKIGELRFEQPLYNFKEVFDVIKNKQEKSELCEAFEEGLKGGLESAT